MPRLFDGARYKVDVTQPAVASRGTVIHFEGIRPVDPTTGRFAAEPPEDKNFATKAGLTGVFVQPVIMDWYQHETLDDALDTIRSADSLPRPWLAYGNSMGGYGATAAAQRLGADFFLAGSPQASINPAYFANIGETRWLGHTSHYRHDPILDGSGWQMEGIVLCDPLCRADQVHADAIIEHTAGRQLFCHGSAHFGIFRVTRDMGIRPFLEGLFNALSARSSVDDFITRCQAVFDNSIAKEFFDADVKGQLRLLDREGAEHFLRMIHHTAVVEAYERQPSAGLADLLDRLIPFLGAETKVHYVKAALQRQRMKGAQQGA